MLTLRKFNRGSFWLVLVLLMFSGQTRLYGSQQLPDNIMETTLTWINKARAQEGLETLSIDSQLNKVAETHNKQMIKHNILSDNNPALGTPFERMQSSGLSETNNLEVVAQANTWTLLREQLGSPENLSKILSPEMTHAGVSIVQDSTGDLWLTIHMTERAITFTQFTLNQSNTAPVKRYITIKGNTSCNKIKAILIPPEGSNHDLAAERIVIPDSKREFEVTFTFGAAAGIFEFEFYVEKDGTYKLKNFFSMNI